MTRERLMELAELVDVVNEKLDVCASIEHSKYSDEIHVVMFFMKPNGERYPSKWFTTDYVGGDDWVTCDKDLEKAEKYLRDLLKQAEANDFMREEK